MLYPCGQLYMRYLEEMINMKTARIERLLGAPFGEVDGALRAKIEMSGASIKVWSSECLRHVGCSCIHLSN